MDAAPNLTCLGQGDTPPADPPTVTLQGFLDVFSSGPEPTGVRVQVFDLADLEVPAADAGGGRGGVTAPSELPDDQLLGAASAALLGMVGDEAARRHPTRTAPPFTLTRALSSFRSVIAAMATTAKASLIS